MREAGRPLVMTSGNLAEEPMATDDAEALARLFGLADLFLLHDRAIVTRCDDSVARIVAGGPLLIRRSRGYVPRPIRLARPVAAPILACGGHLKNTFCLAAGDEAWLGPHVGDLETVESVEALAEDVRRFSRFLGIVPEVIAHDLHPDYASTAYARARPEARKVGVQHHHAHVAAVMAEHALAGPVLGVAYDGSGYGTDGRAWGGEILLAREENFERLATVRPLALAGGAAAIREPWRLALALLDDTFGDEAPLDRFAVFAGLRPGVVAAVRRLLRGTHTPRAHGVGRYFDAVSSLVGGRAVATFEGQAALEWDAVADPSERRPYGFTVDHARAPSELDLRPMVREVVADVRAGRPPSAVSARFHATLAAATAALVREAGAAHGVRRVVLAGGCFQNARLAEDVIAALDGHDVFLPRQAPPGDGGLALGQVVVADAVLRAGRPPCA
jgi:hydrogenase maturation protein HypF